MLGSIGIQIGIDMNARRPASGSALGPYAVNGIDAHIVFDPAATSPVGGYYLYEVGSPTVAFASLVTYLRSTTALTINSDGEYTSTAINTPRFTHSDDGAGGFALEGMLIEGTENNLLTYTGDIATQWTFTGSPTTGTGSALGGLASTRVTATVAGNTRANSPSFSMTTGLTYTLTVVSRKESGTGWLNTRTVVGSPSSLRFNLNTGEFGTVSGAWFNTFKRLRADGFWEWGASFVATATASTKQRIDLIGVDGGAPTIGDAVDLIGAQPVQNTAPSSLILNTGTTVPRGAGDARIIAARVTDSILAATGGTAMPTEFSGTAHGVVSYADEGAANQIVVAEQLVDATHFWRVTIDTDGVNTGVLTFTMQNGGSPASVSTTLAELLPGADVDFKVAWRATATEINIALGAFAETAVASTIGVPDVRTSDIEFYNNGGFVAHNRFVLWWDDIGDLGLAEANLEEPFIPFNRTVSWGLQEVNDFSVQEPYYDFFKSSRELYGNTTENGFNAATYEDLLAAGLFDANGWPTDVPATVTTAEYGLQTLEEIQTIWAVGGREMPGGTFRLQYDGAGTITVGQGASETSSSAGEILFTLTANTSFTVTITDTDPLSTGDYIRNITVVRTENTTAFDAGDMFNPGWLDDFSDAAQFRFMDPMRTNASPMVDWANRPKLTDSSWTHESADSGVGIPVEVMVRLANEAGVDPWFCMPHLADDNFIQSFAEYVRDNLNSDRTAYVEYSNELWNFDFSQTNYLLSEAGSVWGTGNETDYQSKKATLTGQIWKDVFAIGSGNPGLVNVLGTHASNPSDVTTILTGAVWLAQEPGTWIDPTTVFDQVATTTYFGSDVLSDATNRTDLETQINISYAAADAWLMDKLLDPAFDSSIPDIKSKLIAMQTVVKDDFGLQMVAYEGGQHVHHNSYGGVDQNTVDTYLRAFVRSSHMGTLYEELWDIWNIVLRENTAPFMHFVDVSTPSKNGSWGIRSSNTDVTDRWTFVKNKQTLSVS